MKTYEVIKEEYVPCTGDLPRGLWMAPADGVAPSCCRAFLFSSPLLISVAFRRPL